tara:strand:- start:995 stop:1558 length:564 start_codon:yes stop_codon:yes gene_type:complete
MSTCFKTSDNKHFGCPPRMADGRHFTDYRPNCHVNDLVKADNNISNSFQFRQFLQQNGDALMDRNRQLACEKNCCGPCDNSFDGFADTMLPEKYMFVTDGRIGKMVMHHPNGVGTGRKYFTFQQDSDCKDLPNAWPNKKNNCISPLDNFAYLGNMTNEPVSQEENCDRVAVPGGGDMLSGGDPRVNM